MKESRREERWQGEKRVDRLLCSINVMDIYRIKITEMAYFQ